MVNIREYLDQNYPKDQRKDETKLDITNKDFEGYLNLDGFVNLKKLNCSGNHFTELDVSSCTKLEKLDCSNNRLSVLNLDKCTSLRELNFSFNSLGNDGLFLPPTLKELERLSCSSNHLRDTKIVNYLNTSKLTSLDIKNNDFSKCSLSLFKDFTNLKLL
jgi:Leucine-rich repeat (LRR) protein